jgi:signal transduction histidine kinase
MLISRLRVRGKLNLLLMLPLLAVVLVAVPYVTDQVQGARSAGTTADAARGARQLGALVWELQRERLLTAGFIASPADDGVELLRQHQAVNDAVASVTASLGPTASDELASALTRVGSLRELRDGALHRGVSLDSVARAYHAVIEAVIDALRLVPQRTSDAEGTRQLTALDALLRANEESTLYGMALIAAAYSPASGVELLTDAASRADQFTERFVEQADPDQAAQVVLVDQGEAARRVNAVAGRLPAVRGAGAVIAFARDALNAVDSQSTLRRLVQDRVTSEIADAAGGRASVAQAVAWTVGLGIALLFVLVATLALVVSRSIAGPLQRVTRAATSVAELADAELVRVGDVDVDGAEEAPPPRLAALEVTSGDEVGELAQAFNRVQSTAAELVERQIVSRRNVSLMFTNVAQRTRNLVSRQLAVVDELERDEESSAVLAHLYRLDHLATRLRRNAENLLVLAGSREEARIKRPTALATTLRGALTEIEDYQRVRLADVCEVTLASEPASDLVLVFAELLENATAFSSPESAVEVGAELTADGTCLVTVVDHGIGMAALRMAEENHRLVERERLELAPTSVLGLFVVGRLSRRHGIGVELTPTPGGGTTVTVTIPATLFRVGIVDVPPPPTGPVRATAGLRRPALTAPAFVVPGPPTDGFTWFAQPAAVPPVAPALATGAGPAPEPVPAGAPRRRVPGAQLPAGTPLPRDAGGAQRDPDAARARMAEYQAATYQATTPRPTVAATPDPPAAAAPALTRRVPGAHLAPALRDRQPGTPGRPVPGQRLRDPATERATFDSYSSGWARATAQRDRPRSDRFDEGEPV